MREKGLAPLVATLLAILAMVASPASSDAEELSLLYGMTETKDSERQTSYAWGADFRYRVVPHLALSAGYLNEGHLPGHKRDGLSTQLWGDVPFFRRRVDLALGAGAYYHFDTKSVPGGFEDARGLAAIYSLSATYNTSTPFFGRLMVNRVAAHGTVHTNTVLLGAGYRLWETRSASGEAPPEEKGKTGDEITVLVGRTVLNSLKDQHGTATEIELRKGILPHFDGTLSWLNEGETRIIRRNGITAQLSLTDEFMDDRLTLGIGGGIYGFLNRNKFPRRAGLSEAIWRDWLPSWLPGTSRSIGWRAPIGTGSSAAMMRTPTCSSSVSVTG